MVDTVLAFKKNSDTAKYPSGQAMHMRNVLSSHFGITKIAFYKVWWGPVAITHNELKNKGVVVGGLGYAVVKGGVNHTLAKMTFAEVEAAMDFDIVSLDTAVNLEYSNKHNGGVLLTCGRYDDKNARQASVIVGKASGLTPTIFSTASTKKKRVLSPARFIPIVGQFIRKIDYIDKEFVKVIKVLKRKVTVEDGNGSIYDFNLNGRGDWCYSRYHLA